MTISLFFENLLSKLSLLGLKMLDSDVKVE